MVVRGNGPRYLQETFFVGREQELARFHAWLTGEEPLSALFVIGRGGIGKSTLLRGFAREALTAGRSVILLDCRTFTCTPTGLLGELGYPDLASALAGLNQIRPLLMLDTFEEAGELRRFLWEEFLPQLGWQVKVVLAGRFPPIPFASDAPGTAPNIQMMMLSPFSPPESREYLNRRGLAPVLVEQLIAATAGNPLAISLAADMAIHLEIRDFAAAPEWHLVVRSLVERLLQDVQDHRLRELLYAGAVVRQFDELTLATLTGETEIESAFGQLCRLATVRASAHGLMLHGDIRKILLHDLRWRRPGQYETFRKRAFTYYLERLRSASPVEREWLLTEIFFLWEDGVIQGMAFSEEESGELWLEPGRPADYDQIRRIWNWALRHVLAPEVDGMTGDTGEEPMLEAVLKYPDIRLRVVRDRTGRVLGFGTAVPVCEESLPFFELWSALMPLVNAYIARYGRENLPRGSAQSRAWFLVHLVHGELMPERVEAALVRDLLGFFSGGGIYLIAAPIPKWKQFAEALGFQLVQEARTWVNGPAHPVEGYMLDLTQSGVAPWVEAIMLGHPLPRSLTPPELERELKAVLSHWQDDGLLSRSLLAHSALLNIADGEACTPDQLRRAILTSLERAVSGGSEQIRDDLRALELAYLRKGGTHEQNAARMNVSRATFYRMLERGIRQLAASIGRD